VPKSNTNESWIEFWRHDVQVLNVMPIFKSHFHNERDKMNEQDKSVYWWLAINGASCAASSIPLPDDVVVRPTPERLLGYRTQAEQLDDQHRFLHHPLDSVRNYVRQILPRKVRAGEIKQLIMQQPERPTTETQWIVGNDQIEAN
jgi:hypothetical protein